MLGAIAGVEGLSVGAATLVTVLQLASNASNQPVMLLLWVLIGCLGTAGTFAVGRHHDARNPSKRYFT
jgi:hypothetical protein